MNAAVLTIGNEVSSGQIVNSNAAWISQRLDWLKLDVSTHLTVQDEDKQILAALDFVSDKAEVIFITGGLGPTRDDLTRHSVCKWVDDELVFDEGSWTRIVKRLTDLGVPVSESNRQQCYFPKTSRILENQAGTANAFYIKKDNLQIWCLPGPPREISQIWADHIDQQLKTLFANKIEGLSLFRWQCLGKSESALGEIVESAIEGSTLTSGYRPHIPFVEIKLWSPDQDRTRNEPYLKAVEKAISPWLVSREDEDLAILLAQKLSRYDGIKVFDFSKSGYLAFRIGTSLSKLGFQGQITILSEWVDQESPQNMVQKCLELADPETLTLCLDKLRPDGSWDLGLSFDGFLEIERLSSPYRPSKYSERFVKLQVEKSFYHWPKLLQRLPSGIVN